MKERPILFSSPMVKAIIDGRKTMTRRVIRPQPVFPIEAPNDCTIHRCGGWATGLWSAFRRVRDICGQMTSVWQCNVTLHDTMINWEEGEYPYLDTNTQCRSTASPYGIPGDRLYVKETYTLTQFDKPVYRADSRDATGALWHSVAADPDGVKWKSSMFMPRRFARLALEITGVKVEQVQNISLEDIEAEGVRLIDTGCSGERGTLAYQDFQRLWDSINAKPKPIKHKGIVTHYVSYPWEDIRETREYRGKPWYVTGNPWCWCISFKELKP